MLPSTIYIMGHMHLQSLKWLHPTVFEMHLQENILFVAQYPLHHVTYSPAKFEIATSNGLEEDAFTRKYII